MEAAGLGAAVVRAAEAARAGAAAGGGAWRPMPLEATALCAVAAVAAWARGREADAVSLVASALAR